MAFKDLLLQLRTYPDATPASAVEQAVSLAEQLGARLTTLTFEIDFHIPTNPLANAVLDIPAMIATERNKSIANIQDLASVLDSAAAKHGVTATRITERSRAAEMPAITTDYARLRDLTMIPVSESEGAQRQIAEGVIFGSGRPVLVLPEKVRRPVALEAIGVAWDFSRPAARAVADALPLLQRAKMVRIVTVTHEKTFDTKRSGPELARHLACHGVEVVLEEENAAGRPVGEALEAYANARNLDLLIMGAFGHSRMREFVLGGATRSMLTAPPLPVLMSH